jgi:hypothetical protein
MTTQEQMVMTIGHSPAMPHREGKRLGALWKMDRADREVEYRCDLCRETCDPVPVAEGFQFCQGCLRRVHASGNTDSTPLRLIPDGLDEGELLVRATNLRLTYADPTFTQQQQADRVTVRAAVGLAFCIGCVIAGVVAALVAAVGR